MAEWSKAADSKSVVPLAVPRVRIPISPPFYLSIIKRVTLSRPLTFTKTFTKKVFMGG